MKRVLVLCEGQTEERFVTDLLAPHLAGCGIWPEPIRIATKVVRGQRTHRGGHGGNYDFIRRDVHKLLRSSPEAVTTMLDVYALPANFPGRDTAPLGDAYARVRHMEAAFAADVSDRRFIANLVLHEFEGLLFSDPEVLQAYYPDRPLLDSVRQLLHRHRSPEEIDESPQTAPSKRLSNLCPGYDKVSDGLLLAQRIGLSTMRAQCPHFNEWILQMERL